MDRSGTSGREGEYGERFSRLRTNRNRRVWTLETAHQAPHKPLLLLAVMDMIEVGDISSPRIEPADDLVEFFGGYWSCVLPFSPPGNIALPFFHMRSEGFWHLEPFAGRGRVSEPSVSSVTRLRELYVGARLDEDLFFILSDPESRERLRSTLIRTYFSEDCGRRVAERGRINCGAFVYGRELLEYPNGIGCVWSEEVREAVLGVDGYATDEDAGSEPSGITYAVRDQGFRRAVVAAYSHRCALCGIRVRTPEGHTTVTGAHIVPWSKTRDDRPANGLGLCRTCHWTFDEGLLGISGSYDVIASRHLNAKDNLSGYLTSLEGRRIFLPISTSYHPDKDSLAWHQDNVLR